MATTCRAASPCLRASASAARSVDLLACTRVRRRSSRAQDGPDEVFQDVGVLELEHERAQKIDKDLA
eukprot:1921473-Pleurochrysis_carterae.AAC.1